MPRPELLVGAVLLVALVLYALLGGADFGGGVWDLFAGGPRKGAQRSLISQALAPVWEVNHIWLILAWVLLFTAFPPAFAALGQGLHAPLTLFLFGVIGRGSAFAFRSFDTRGDRTGERWGLLFAVCSLMAPLLLGAIVGALAAGDLTAWHRPFALLTGGFTLALFAFLAAVYLCAEAGADGRLADDFRRRALGSGVAVGVLAAAVLLLARSQAPRVFESLTQTGGALGLHLATAAAALSSFGFLLARRFRAARLSAAAQVTLIVLGWGAAQYPLLAPPDLTLFTAASHEATLRLVLGVLVGGALVLIPSLVFLFSVFKRAPGAAPGQRRPSAP